MLVAAKPVRCQACRVFPINVKPAAKLLYLYLAGRGRLDRSNGEIAEAVGLTYAAYIRTRQSLSSAGLLTYDSGITFVADDPSLGRIRNVPDDIKSESPLTKLIWLYLARVGPLSADELKSQLGIGKITVWRATEKLEELGLVNRIHHTPAKYEAAQTTADSK